MNVFQSLCFPYTTLSQQDIEEEEEEDEKKWNQTQTVVKITWTLPNELWILVFDYFLSVQDIAHCVCVCKDWKKLITECSYQYRAWRRPLKPIRERIGTDLTLSSELPLLALLLLCGHGDVQICEWFVHQYPIGTKEKIKLMDCLQAAYYERHYAVCRWLDANFQLSDYVSAEIHDVKVCYASNQALLRCIRNCTEPMLPNLNTDELLDNFRSLFPADRILYDNEDFNRKRNQLKFLLRFADVAFYEEYESCINGYCDDWEAVFFFLLMITYGGNEQICDRFLALILKKYKSDLWRLRNTLSILQTHKEYRICCVLLHDVDYFHKNALCPHLAAMIDESSSECKHALMEDHALCCTEISTHNYCKTFMNILERQGNTVEHVRWFCDIYGFLLQQSSRCYYRWTDSANGDYREMSNNEGGRYHCVDIFFLMAYRRASSEVIAYIHERFPIPQHCIADLLYKALLCGQKQAVRWLLPQVQAAGSLYGPHVFEFAARSVKPSMLRWLLLELGEEHELCIPTKYLCMGLRDIQDATLWNQTLHLLQDRNDFQENGVHLLASLVHLTHGTHYRNYVALLSFVKKRVNLEEGLWQRITREFYQFAKSTVPSGTTIERCRDMMEHPHKDLCRVLHQTIDDLYWHYSVGQETFQCETFYVFET